LLRFQKLFFVYELREILTTLYSSHTATKSLYIASMTMYVYTHSNADSYIV